MISTITKAVSGLPVHRLFEEKHAISAAVQQRLEPVLARRSVHLASFQLLGVQLPPEYETAVLASAITRLSIVHAEAVKRARTVSFQTYRLAARYTRTQRVVEAHGTAQATLRRALGNVVTLRRTVEGEMAAFGNHTSLHRTVRPREVVEYTWYDTVVRGARGASALNGTLAPLGQLLALAPPSTRTRQLADHASGGPGRAALRSSKPARRIRFG